MAINDQLERIITALDYLNKTKTTGYPLSIEDRVYTISNQLQQLVDSGFGELPIHVCTAEEYDPETGIPTVENPEENTFYLVPNVDPEDPNMFMEYIYTGDHWELFGSGGQGVAGVGIASIVKTGTSGKIDTYTITYTDGTTTTFQIVNGADGANVTIEETLVSGEDYALDFEETGISPVESVAGKTGVVVLDGGDVGYSAVAQYSNGTIGKTVQGLDENIFDLQQDIDSLGGNNIPLDSTDVQSETIEEAVSSLKTQVSEFPDQIINAYIHPMTVGPASLVTVLDGADMPMQSVVVNIEPVQSGSGDQSPTNDRPISGFDAVEISVSGADTSDPDVTEVAFPASAGTVFGGYIDITKGKLTANRVSMTLNGSEDNWNPVSSGTGYHQFTLRLSNAIYGPTATSINSRFPIINATDRGIKSGLVYYTADSNFRFALNDSDFNITTLDGWKAYLAQNNIQIVLYLTTPVVYDLDPVTIKTLYGTNNIWANTGNITVEYLADAKLYINGDRVGKIAYVSTSGNDSNDGSTPQSPFATINHALEKGYNNIRVFGGKYLQRIDLTKLKSASVSITAYERDKQPVFIDSGAILSTSASSVSGYTKVKKFTKAMTIDANLIWIFQDGSSDVTTLISDAERHPLQRGKVYRCYDTMIEKCTSATLADALTEIENADTYKWYKDGNDWYFSSPEAVSSNKPICAGRGYSFINMNGVDVTVRNIAVNISGIAVKYMSFNISGTVNSTITDCMCANVKDDGCFKYDNCLNATFVRCEAARCRKGDTGDGFNAHASNAANDAFAKCVTGMMIDCWAHDNYDDGYSNHQRGEDTIIGGLFEYNGKAGVTPSYGTHCTCYNVLSRQNYGGFYVVGEADSAEGGVGTQLICYNCVAQDNFRGGLYTGFYTAHAGNSAILYNCKAIGNNRAYRAAENTTMLLVDCTALDNHAEIKYGDGTITVKNTTLVT